MKTNIKIAIVGLVAVVVAVFVVASILGKPVQVVIDPGHGGKDVGAVYGERYEKDDNLALALLVNEKLHEMGIESVMTRNGDKQVSLENRCKIANFKKADLFVSVHRNSAEGAKGVEVWIESDNPEPDRILAQRILDGLEEAGISKNRGVKNGFARGDGDYYVNSHTEMPSCLVELGFINSETDNELFDKNIEAYAQAIANAVAKSLPKE